MFRGQPAHLLSQYQNYCWAISQGEHLNLRLNPKHNRSLGGCPLLLLPFSESPLPLNQSLSPVGNTSLCNVSGRCPSKYIRGHHPSSGHCHLSPWLLQSEGSSWNVNQIVVCLLKTLQTSPIALFLGVAYTGTLSNLISRHSLCSFYRVLLHDNVRGPTHGGYNSVHLELGPAPGFSEPLRWFWHASCLQHWSLTSAPIRRFSVWPHISIIWGAFKYQNLVPTLSDSDLASGLVPKHLYVYIYWKKVSALIILIWGQDGEPLHTEGITEEGRIWE